jgi:hypothetical protein
VRQTQVKFCCPSPNSSYKAINCFQHTPTKPSVIFCVNLYVILLWLDLVWLCRKSSWVECKIQDELKLPNPRQIQVKLKSMRDKLNKFCFPSPNSSYKAINYFQHTPTKPSVIFCVNVPVILLELDLVWLCRKSSQVKCESEDELKLPNLRQIQVKLKSVQDKLNSNFVVLPQIRVPRLSTVSTHSW